MILAMMEPQLYNNIMELDPLRILPEDKLLFKSEVKQELEHSVKNENRSVIDLKLEVHDGLQNSICLNSGKVQNGSGNPGNYLLHNDFSVSTTSEFVTSKHISIYKNVVDSCTTTDLYWENKKDNISCFKHDNVELKLQNTLLGARNIQSYNICKEVEDEDELEPPNCTTSVKEFSIAEHLSKDQGTVAITYGIVSAVNTTSQEKDVDIELHQTKKESEICLHPDPSILIDMITATIIESLNESSNDSNLGNATTENNDEYKTDAGLGRKAKNGKFIRKIKHLHTDKNRDSTGPARRVKQCPCPDTNCNRISPSKRHSKKRKKKFMCHICGAQFTHIQRLNDHCNAHTSLKPHTCPDCGKAFGSKDNLTKHIKRVHTCSASDDVSRVCDVCGKVCSSMYTLRSHLRTHRDKHLKCAHCNLHFLNPSRLEVHMTIHTGERPFECDVCSKRFRLKTILKRHILLSHEKRKNFKCTKCEKSFQAGPILQEHLLKHEGIRKYSCETCGKTFAQSSHLAAHKFSHGEKKFVCSICGAKFNRNDNMKSHVKRHGYKSGE